MSEWKKIEIELEYDQRWSNPRFYPNNIVWMIIELQKLDVDYHEHIENPHLLNDEQLAHQLKLLLTFS